MTQNKENHDTESAILRAAEHEFLTKGFAGARTTSIAESAGVTHAMFHYYFRTKDKLFDRIMGEKVVLVKEAIQQTMCDSDMPFEEKIRNIIEKHLEFVSANPDLPRFLVGEVFSSPERTALLLDKIKIYAPAMIDALQKDIDEEVKKGRCRQVDAKMLIIDITSLNIFAFMASPLINAVLGNCMENSEEFLSRRKIENFDTIMRKLKP